MGGDAIILSFFFFFFSFGYYSIYYSWGLQGARECLSKLAGEYSEYTANVDKLSLLSTQGSILAKFTMVCYLYFFLGA